MTDNPYASPSPENNPAPLKSGQKFSLIHLLWIVPVGLVVIALFIPAPRRGREASRRTQCKNNLKQIGLALHNYHDIYGAFPPAYTVDSTGKRVHSWRTLILPFVDQAPLYEKIDLSKAWDDPVNADAAKAQVHAYHCPTAPGPNINTSYMVIIGVDTCFPGAVSRTLGEVKDGAANTMMVVEVDSEKSIPWMSPMDVDEQFILSVVPKSKSSHVGGLHALLADGTVRFISSNLDVKTRHSLMTIDAGDTVGDF
jgi:hypothetical protein